MKQKTCKNKSCKKKFIPERQMQSCCDFLCAIEHSRNTQKKHDEKRKQISRKALKQFNDSDISVLVGDGRQFHCGHYKPQGGNSLLRFDEKNCHAQCSICNNHKSGNLIPYRENIIKMYGLKFVEEMESMNTIKKWAKKELQEIIDKYRVKVKELKND